MRVREILCKSALVKSGITGVDFVLNPYTGCEHGCVYCYASFMLRFRPHPEPWGAFVDVKVNFAELLRKELRRAGDGEIMLSSVTDPYQPVEAEYKITRSCLEALQEMQESRNDFALGVPPVSILTKSDLVTRDIDILSGMRTVQVGMTITTPDDGLSGLLEPRAPVSSRRFRALENLSKKGIFTWAFAGPLIPYYSDGAGSIRKLFGRFREAGVQRVLVDRMNMYPACLGRLLHVCRGDDRALRRISWARANPAEYEEELRLSIEETQAEAGCPVEIVF